MSEEIQTGAEADPLDSTVQASPESDQTVTETTEASVIDAAEVAEETQELNEFQLESEIDQFETEIDTALKAADAEKDPAWYRNALTQYKRHLGQVREQHTPYKDLQGAVTPDQLPDAVEMLRSLHNVRMTADGVPKPDVSKFSEILETKYGDIVQDLIYQLGSKQVPGTNLNYFATALQQQFGIDPSQLEAVKSYLENNSAPDVPPQFAEAYRNLSPKLKEELAYMDEETRLELLQREQVNVDRDKQAKQSETDSRQAFTQQVEQAAEARYLQGANTAMDAMAKTLEKATFSTDPQVNELIIEENLQLVLNALNPYSAGYQRARQAISKIGVVLDEGRVNNILDTLAEESRNIEYFERSKQPDRAKASEAKYARSLQELIAQGHKVAGQILRVRGQGVTASATAQAGALKQTTGRPVIQGSPTAGGDANDWLKNLPPAGTQERHAAIAQLVTSQNNS